MHRKQVAKLTTVHAAMHVVEQTSEFLFSCDQARSAIIEHEQQPILVVTTKALGFNLRCMLYIYGFNIYPFG